ncbi:MAG: hypothetical protein IJ088_11070 [Clostridia bacterium]|nr:hypothetical protein [Clostridia bacterium]
MKRIVSIICLAALLVSILSMTAFAEGNADYGFNKGKAENESRHAVYSQLGKTTEQVDKSGYVDSHVNANSTTIATLNAEALVEAGVIDQETAGKIAAYATQKHTNISAIYEGMDSMSPTARHDAFAARKSTDSNLGDTVTELVTSEVITQEQADAINAYLNR